MAVVSVFCYLMIISSFAVLSKGFCQSGWFGEKCQYKCHCEGICSTTGDCVVSKHCQPGWFGLNCQYRDLANELGSRISFNIPQYSNWLTDGDDFTCNLNPEFNQLIVTWDKIQVFSWMRLITRDPSRNMALKQTAVQSSLYIDYSTPSKAVDGNTDSYFESKSCTHTAFNDAIPTWTLVLNEPVVAKMFAIYNRYDSSAIYTDYADRLKHFLLLGLDEYNKTIMNYRETSDVDQMVYRVPSLNLHALKSVQIKLDITHNPILTLCEVEIYAECPPGKWGLGCNESCPVDCEDQCRVDDGSCNTQCAGQSDPPICSKECVHEKWGLNCNFDCSTHCLNQVCDRLTGKCSSGCLGYRDPPYCTQTCPDGYWGVNCTDECSIQCDGLVCDGQNKTCTHGCKSGYMMPNCTQECFEGFYGVNCSSKCSTNCDGGKCDPVLGICTLCPDGFQGALCDQECYLGFWGSNCSQQCSNHCIQLKCQGQTSECIFGCHDGFLPPNCTEACPSGTFGKNCHSICHCHLGSKCDPTNGECVAEQPQI